jgi:hypothetical protein
MVLSELRWVKIKPPSSESIPKMEAECSTEKLSFFRTQRDKIQKALSSKLRNTFGVEVLTARTQ